ncbi:MAG: hypothetical protein AAGA42_06480 [Actinomycetota bacterium]
MTTNAPIPFSDPGPVAPPAPRRLTGDRGSGLVAGLALLFAFTFLGLVWLARDVDRGVSNRSAAHSIAFQSARAGAQVAQVADLRNDSVIEIDAAPARQAALHTASALLSSYGLDGSVTSIAIDGDRISVTVSIDDAGIRATGVGTVRAERAP